MNMSRIFIERPVATSVLFVSIMFFGWLAFTKLPVNDLPNVDYPTLVVIAQLPGGNPETMASAVATPLERQFSTIEGLDSMTSINSFIVLAGKLGFTSHALGDPPALVTGMKSLSMSNGTLL